MAGLKYEVQKATGAAHDGKVIFKLENGGDVTAHYLIFDITARPDAANKRVVVQNGQAENLAAGKYEFLLLDRRNKNCFKEIVVDVNE